MYISATLEEDRFMTWALGIGKSGYGLGRFVFKASQHFMNTFWAKRLEEPLARHPSVDRDILKIGLRNCEYLHVWAW